MSTNDNNPYQAYFNAMIDMQKGMANAYFEAQKAANGELNMPPPFAMGMNPFMMPGHCPPPMNGQAMPPSFMQHGGMPPHWAHQSPPPQEAPQQVPEEESNPLFDQAQVMLDEALGEDAGTFKQILGSFGMTDKEFWKGAMVGAAAALLLSNDKVRGKLMDVASGAGDLLKTGGSAAKESAESTAKAVKESVVTSNEIFKDTYAAGKQGFQESVDKHKAEQVQAAENDQDDHSTPASEQV